VAKWLFFFDVHVRAECVHDIVLASFWGCFRSLVFGFRAHFVRFASNSTFSTAGLDR